MLAPVTHQATGSREITILSHRRHRVLERHRSKLHVSAVEELAPLITRPLPAWIRFARRER
jgi:hypothetical protein